MSAFKLLKNYSHKPYFIIIFIAMFITALDGIVIPNLISNVLTALELGNNHLLIRSGLLGILGYFFVRTGLFFWDYFQQKYIQYFMVSIKRQLIKQFFIYEKPMNDNQFYNLMTTEIKYLENAYVNATFHFIYSIMFSLVTAIYIFILDWRTSLIFIIFSILPFIVPFIFKKKIKETTTHWSNNNETYLSQLNEYIDQRLAFKLFQTTSVLFKRLNKTINNLEDSYFTQKKVSNQSRWITNILSGISSFVPVIIGGLFVTSGDLSMPHLVAIFLASDRVVSPIINAIHHYNNILSTETMREKITDFLEPDQGTKISDDTESISVLPLIIKNGMLKYDDHLVLKDIHLAIYPGDHVLINGPSGSGKTTLFKAIIGLLDLSEGDLLYGGQSIENKPLFSSIGYFTQQYMLFDDSLHFNLTLGENYSHEQLVNVLDWVGLKQLVQQKGLDFQLGKHGDNLSVGQKARVALARLLLRDYELVLVDEFSANLDSATQTLIRTRLFEKYDTIIEISHQHIKADYNKIYSIENKTLKAEELTSV